MTRSKMKDWMFLTGDVNWEDYGAKWCRKDASGVWWVLDFSNKEEWGNGARGYYCEVKRLDLAEVHPTEIKSALRSCGWRIDPSRPAIVNEYDGHNVHGNYVIAEGLDNMEPVLVECLVGYGVSAPMGSEEGTHPTHVRAAARRLADELMADEKRAEAALAKPVNKIGSTARDFGRGDSLAGLRRVSEKLLRGEDVEVDTSMSLMLRMYAASNGQTLGGVKEAGLAAAGRILLKEGNG
jgi:hypothetical protein